MYVYTFESNQLGKPSFTFNIHYRNSCFLNQTVCRVDANVLGHKWNYYAGFRLEKTFVLPTLSRDPLSDAADPDLELVRNGFF